MAVLGNTGVNTNLRGTLFNLLNLVIRAAFKTAKEDTVTINEFIICMILALHFLWELPTKSMTIPFRLSAILLTLLIVSLNFSTTTNHGLIVDLRPWLAFLDRQTAA